MGSGGTDSLHGSCRISIRTTVKSLQNSKWPACRISTRPIKPLLVQKGMDEVNPYVKSRILGRAVDYIDAHEEEIIDIIIKELGGTRLKAFLKSVW